MPAGTDLVLERLTKLHPKIIDLSLDRVWRLLEKIGSPERRLPPVVHVAGTNGKGSVIAYLRAMLEAAGRRVHVYTSPHLVRFHERIRLNGALIGEPDLLRLLEECEAANGGTPITFFEITTCAAFLAFARQPADILLMEVGLGGRLDATNVVERPQLTLQMPISYDHMQFLGHTLTAIAGEKAGIMKRGVPAVIAPQPAEAAAVFDAKARELDIEQYRYGREWNVEAAGDAMLFRDNVGERRLPLPGLAGRHQIDNAGTAVACLKYLRDFGVDGAAMARGLREVEWPARLQRLTRGPLAALLPPGWELWLDGAHNASGGEAMSLMAADWAGAKNALPLYLISGSLSTHDPAGLLRPLAPYVAAVRTVIVPGDHKTLPAEAVAEAARQAGIAAKAAASVNAALADIVAAAKGPARVLICGSLYLAGSVLEDNG
ncbi:MAG TPA: folylpolyglutamate synthase/dihydrofolate synthase family protein [Dongiaceae bacterium]|jgi:dihydrofolate synthase/folylpolyglutamate synthase